MAKLIVWFIAVSVSNILSATEGEMSFTTIAPDLTKVEDQNMTLTWVVSDNVAIPLEFIKIIHRKSIGSENDASAFYNHDKKTFIPQKAWTSRSEDVHLNVSFDNSGLKLYIVLTLENLKKSTDEGLYIVDMTASTNSLSTGTSDKTTKLTVNIPTLITSSYSYTIAANENQIVKLVCNATGFPTPTVNWTRNGEVVGTGSPFSVTAKPEDHNQCYTCIVFNGVYDAKTANVCLTVQYKPRNASLTVDRSTVCQNDTVNMTCTSGPSNPAPSSYKFYHNNVIVQNSPSNVYTTRATHGSPIVNRFTCVPSNLLGDAVKNATVDVIAKYPPSVAVSPRDVVLVEGQRLTLFCNASGHPAPNVTWFKVGGNTLRHGNTFTISNVSRGDEGSYRSVVSNGQECDTDNAIANVTVYVPPNCVHDTLEITNGQCVSIRQSDGNPLPAINCYQTGNIMASQNENAYTLCGVKSKTTSICTIANAAGRCSFIVKVYQRVTDYFYKGSFRITNRLYRDSLNDKTSVEFKILKANIENMLKSVYTSYKYATSAEVIGFWPGSVIVVFQLKLIANINDPLSPMMETLRKNGGYLNGLKIDPKSIQPGEYVTTTTTITSKATTFHLSSTSQSNATPCTESSQIPAIVLGVLFAISLVSNIILVSYIVWKLWIENKARLKSSSNDNDESFYMNDIALEDKVSSNVVQHESVSSQEQHQPTTQPCQSLQSPSDTYSSLSPNTKLPPSPAALINSGIYQEVTDASSHDYQSLDNFNRV